MKYIYNNIVEVCSSVSVCFSYVSWVGVVKPRLDQQRHFLPYEYGAIEASCLTSSLLAIRKFDDFFRDKRNRHDDVIVSDFDYGSCEILTAAERKDINKRVAHFTTEMESNGKETWAIDDLLKRLSAPLRQFLEYLLEQCGEEDKGECFEISETIKYIDSSLEILSSYGST